jgi:uncharacterized protein YkwD
VPTTYTITPSLTSTRGSSISPTPTSTQGSGNTTTTPTPTSTQGSGSTTTTPAPTSTQGSGNTTTPTPTSTQGNGGTTTTPAPGSTQGSGTAPTATATPLVINEEEKKFLDLINQYRNANNLSLLRVDDSLQRAARWMSEDMANNNRFSHIDSQGRDYPKRLTDFGYTAKPQNETILAGGSSAQSAFDFWTGSAEYNAIILSPKYKAFGIGYAYNMNSTYKFYWTANFGGM